MTARDIRICRGAEDHYLIAEDATASGKRVATRIAELNPNPDRRRACPDHHWKIRVNRTHAIAFRDGLIEVQSTVKNDTTAASGISRKCCRGDEAASNSKRFGAAHHQLRSRPEIRAGESAGRQGGASLRASPSRQMIVRR